MVNHGSPEVDRRRDEHHDGDQSDIQRVESENEYHTDNVPNDTVSRLLLALAHKETDTAFIEALKCWPVEAQDVTRNNEGECP